MCGHGHKPCNKLYGSLWAKAQRAEALSLTQKEPARKRAERRGRGEEGRRKPGPAGVQKTKPPTESQREAPPRQGFGRPERLQDRVGRPLTRAGADSAIAPVAPQLPGPPDSLWAACHCVRHPVPQGGRRRRRVDTKCILGAGRSPTQDGTQRLFSPHTISIAPPCGGRVNSSLEH
jgi:hypothetical protein